MELNNGFASSLTVYSLLNHFTAPEATVTGQRGIQRVAQRIPAGAAQSIIKTPRGGHKTQIQQPTTKQRTRCRNNNKELQRGAQQC